MSVDDSNTCIWMPASGDFFFHWRRRRRRRLRFHVLYYRFALYRNGTTSKNVMNQYKHFTRRPCVGERFKWRQRKTYRFLITFIFVSFGLRSYRRRERYEWIYLFILSVIGNGEQPRYLFESKIGVCTFCGVRSSRTVGSHSVFSFIFCVSNFIFS